MDTQKTPMAPWIKQAEDAGLRVFHEVYTQPVETRDFVEEAQRFGEAMKGVTLPQPWVCKNAQ